MAWTASHKGPDGRLPQGYWGPITSSLLWCEDKYRFSKYVAEPMNSATNIVFIALALYGAHKSQIHGLPLRYTITNLGIALVGLGSLAFHATLLYEAQLLDELPMIYTSLCLSYCILEDSKRGAKAKKGGIGLPLGLASVGALITAGYLALPNPILHQVAYAAIQIATTGRVLFLLFSPKSPLARTDDGGVALGKRRIIRQSYVFGTAVFLLGFAIWNIDNAFCDVLRSARRYVGYPFAVLLEGHAWWHILTGYGAYHLVASAGLLGMILKDDAASWTFKGYEDATGAASARAFLLPEVVRVSETAKPSKRVTRSMNGTANGNGAVKAR